MTMRQAFWLMPCAAAIHHLEKGWAIARLPQASVELASPGQWGIALAVVTAATLVLAAWAARSRPKSFGVYVALGAQLAAGLNVAAFAVLAARSGAYQPGLISGIVLVVPLTVYLLARAVGEGYASRRGLLGVAVATLLLFLGAAWGSGRLTQWLHECLGCA